MQKTNFFEKYFIILLIIITIIIYIPYFYINFSYISYFHGDMITYFSKILRAKESTSWLIYNNYTTEIHQSTLIYIFYILLGKIAKLFSLSVFTIFYIAQIFSGILLILTIYWVIAFFIDNKILRKISILLIIFSTGIGVFFYNTNLFQYIGQSMDLYKADAMPIIRIFNFPHATSGLIFILLALVFQLKGWEQKKYKLCLFSGIFLLLASFSVPHLLLVYFLSFFFYLMIYCVKNKNWLEIIKLYLISSSIGLIYIVYLFFIMQNNLGWGVMYSQIYLIKPSLPNILLSFGVVFFLILYAIFKKIPFDYIKHYQLLFIWVIVAILAVYNPIFQYKDRFLDGIYIPLAILGSVGFYYLWKNKKNVWNYIIYYLIISFSCYIIFYNTMFSLFFPINNKINFAKKDILPVAQWFNSNNQKKYIFSSSYTGAVLPIYCNSCFVFYGTLFETNDALKKQIIIDNFYQNKYNPQDAKLIFKKYNIIYVIYGPEERKIGKLDLNKYDFLELEYDKNEVKIYKVVY